MTVIRPNSISGITSLTAHRGSIDFYAHDGSAATFNNINSNVTSGVSTFASLNITGDLDVGGALTYEDVTNIDSVGVVTARAGVKVPDSQKIFLGTGNDLAIYHDGSHSYIDEQGTGNLILESNGGEIKLQTSNGGEDLARFINQGAVELFHDNSKKLETTTTGANVTGDFIFGANSKAKLFENGTQSGVQATNSGSSAHLMTHDGNEDIHVDPSGYIKVEVAGSERLRVTSGGDLVVGATGDVYGPARLNLRPDNRQTQFSASDGNTWHDIVVKQNDTNSSGGNACGLAFEISTGGWHANAGTGIAAIKDSNSTDYGSHLAFITRPHAAVAEERLRITSDGKVLINSTTNSDAQLLVKSPDKLHPALKIDGLSSNGFSLLGDEYATDESHFTMGIAYSSASLVTGWGVKVSPTTSNEYLSSQDTYATRHSATRHDNDGWRFLSNSSSQTVTTDSVVSLTERIRISPDGKILKGMTSSLLGSSDVQLTGSGGPATVAGYKSDNNPTGNTSMLTVTGYSQSGSTFTGIGEIDFRVQQGSNTASGYHPGSIVTRVNGGSTTGTHAGAGYSYAGLKDRERITFKSKRYYSLPEWASGSDTYNTFREEWDYNHVVGYNQYSWYRFTSHSSSSSRGGSVDIRVTWSTRHAAGNGYGHWAFHWRDNHSNGYMELGNVYRYHLNYLDGSYYGWSSAPALDVYEINDSGNTAGFYLRVQGHVQANSNTYDGGAMHQFLISAHTNRLGADVNKFEFVGNSTPSDVGSIQGNVNLP